MKSEIDFKITPDELDVFKECLINDFENSEINVLCKQYTSSFSDAFAKFRAVRKSVDEDNDFYHALHYNGDDNIYFEGTIALLIMLEKDEFKKNMKGML